MLFSLRFRVLSMFFLLSCTSIFDNKLKLFWYFCVCMPYWYSKKSFCALPNEEGADNDNFRAHLLFWTPSRFAESWFEVHYYDHTIPKDFIFRKQLRMHLITFSRFLLAFPKSIAVHQIPLINTQSTLLHVVDFCFLGGDIGKICLPHRYTSASQPRFQGPLLPVSSLANEVVGIFHLFSPLANFARRGHISKNSNVDPILGRTNRIRSSATTPDSVKFRVWMSLDRLLQTDRTSEDRLRDKRRSLHATD